MIERQLWQHDLSPSFLTGYRQTSILPGTAGTLPMTNSNNDIPTTRKGGNDPTTQPRPPNMPNAPC